MADDTPMPIKYALPDDHPRQQAYWQRVLLQELHGVQFLWNYVAFVQDGGFNYPTKHFGPQREDESSEQYEQRLAASRTIKAAQAAAGTWADLAVQETATIRPSDAGVVAEWMVVKAFAWCEQGGLEPTANRFRRVAAPLLDAMCPPEHLPRALEVLELYWLEMAHRRPHSRAETARRHPVAALHVAAAMTAGVYGELEPGPVGRMIEAELLDINTRLVEKLAPATSH